MAGGWVPDPGGPDAGGAGPGGSDAGGTVIALRRPGRSGRSRPGRSRSARRFLDATMREVIGRREMMFVACSDGRGGRAYTFRSGPPGFVTVLDPRRLAWRERPGDRVLPAGLHTIGGSLGLGLLFVDFFQDVGGLHVRGQATLVGPRPAVLAGPGPVAGVQSDPAADAVPGRHAERWVVVRIDEAWLDRAGRASVPPLTLVGGGRSGLRHASDPPEERAVHELPEAVLIDRR